MTGEVIHDTGNSVPSGDAYDRDDNTRVLDSLVNGEWVSVVGRTGKVLKSWEGMEQDFSNMLLNSGFEPTHLVYVDGAPLLVSRPTQLIDRSGSVYRVKMPSSFPVTLSGTWGADAALLTEVGDQPLRTQLASAIGETMIGAQKPWAGAIQTTIDTILAQTVYITDFDQTPANTWLSRAIDGTPNGGTLVLPPGQYIAKFSKIRSNITIIGSGMPYYNTAKTALVGGGTTVQGTFGLTGVNIHIEGLGIDSGLTVCNAINGGAAMDALVLNDAARLPLYNCVVRDCIALCRDAASAAHNFLLEGCENSRFENLHARYGQWGVVMKTVNSTADGIYTYACSQAGFTFKSDTGVAGAVALRSSVTNVHTFADDYPAAVTGILIYAATSSLADFQMTNFHINGGLAGLKLLCDSRAANVNLLLGATISNGSIRGCTTFGIEAFGAMSNVLVSNVAIMDTVSNKAIKVWSDCLGIELSNVLASSPVANALNIDLAGRFTLNGVYSMVNGDFNSPSGINLVPDSAATFKLGAYLGTVGFSGAQAWTPAFTGLTVVNGTGGVTITGSFVIIGKMIKWRVKIATTGTATTASTASTTFINNLPFLVLQNGSLRAISGTVTQGGVGLVAEGGTNGYTPTWTAYNGTFTVEGEYFFQV